MNVHHLELFYYVAKHGGISEAVRNIPYGIQQPAVSSQVIQLEDHLGVALFQRRPFVLTPAGEELYEFIRPFFGELENVGQKIRGGLSQQVRIGAAEIILREHLPDILQVIGQKYPKLRVTLREGYRTELESWLEKRELDLIVTLLDGKVSAGTQTLPLLELPLVLLVPTSSRLRSADELWKSDRIDQTLISLPPNEAITKAFRKGLDRAGIDWFAGIEVSSLALVQTYVASGFGIGVSVRPPKSTAPKGVRYLPLTDFPCVTLGVAWSGKPTPLMRDLMQEIKRRGENLVM